MSEDQLSTHFKFMRYALNQAELALKHNEVPVGCIFVYDNQTILSMGKNNTNDTLSGIMHAELVGIEQILIAFNLKRKDNEYDPALQLRINALFSKIDLYVTVEPCVMCGSALKQLGIRKVFFGAGNDRFGGNGSILSLNLDKLIDNSSYKQELHQKVKNNVSNQEYKIQDIQSLDTTYVSYPGFGREEAIILLRKFYVQENKKAPTPQTREADNRFLSLTNFPTMNFLKFITRDQFIHMYGEQNTYRLDRLNDPRQFELTNEGIEVEKFFDPLMPISKELFLEIQQWEKENNVKVFNPEISIEILKESEKNPVIQCEVNVDEILSLLDI